jgi:hypothetical protein
MIQRLLQTNNVRAIAIIRLLVGSDCEWASRRYDR